MRESSSLLVSLLTHLFWKAIQLASIKSTIFTALSHQKSQNQSQDFQTLTALRALTIYRAAPKYRSLISQYLRKKKLNHQKNSSVSRSIY